MPDVIDQIRAEELAAENQSLSIARADNAWASKFNSIPPVEALRASRNLTEQLNTALERRQKLAAQTDLNAQQIYLRQKAFDADMELQPLKVQNMEAQIEREKALTAATGLAERNRQLDEARDMNELSRFVSEVSELDESASDYLTQLSRVAVRHPRALSTQPGLSMFKEKSKRRRSVDELLGQIPADHDVKQIDVDENDNIRVVSQPKAPEGPTFATPEEATAYYGPTATVRQSAKGGWSATIKPAAALPDAVKTKFAEVEGQIAEARALSESPDLLGDKRAEAKAKLLRFTKERETWLKSYPELAPEAAKTAPVAAPSVQRVRQKSTGKMGVIRNGEFIPDA